MTYKLNVNMVIDYQCSKNKSVQSSQISNTGNSREIILNSALILEPVSRRRSIHTSWDFAKESCSEKLLSKLPCNLTYKNKLLH